MSEVAQELLPITIVPCEIFREKDGLAMSSRNVRLTAQQRTAAPEIYRTLLKSKKLFQNQDLVSIKNFVKNEFIQNKELELEYFEVSDKETLISSDKIEPNKKYQAFVAVFAGQVRLIDNIALN